MIARIMIAVVAFAAVVSPAAADDLRGEAARLARIAYDYAYRNSNNNVFRSSRHAHPTRNPFRSSRHYQQKLAASNDGYPLRSFTRLDRRTSRGSSVVEYSFAYPRSMRSGEAGIERYSIFDRAGGYGRIGHLVDDAGGNRLGPRPADRSADSRQRRERRVEKPIPMRVIHREPVVVQEAFLRHEVLADGTVRTVISNSTDAELGDLAGAWQLLATGAAQEAAGAFHAAMTDVDHGVEAMVGYGLAQARLGDQAAAAAMIRRAMAIDPDVTPWSAP